MTKQEEIREGIADIKDDDCKELCPRCREQFSSQMFMTESMVGQLLAFLHSQGVVIKVDRELPKNPYNDKPDEGEWVGYGFAKLGIKRAGYVAVESLIKEVNNELET